MADMTVTVQSMTDKVQQELDKAVERALYAIGTKAIEGSDDAIGTKGSPDYAVDTGRLRASLSFITPQQHGGGTGEGALTGTAEPLTVVIGSNVNYASFVHNGTTKMDARPFLRNGIMSVRYKMQEQVEKIFKGEI